MRKITESAPDPDPEDGILFLKLQAGLKVMFNP